MTEYKKVTQEIVDKLINIVGERNVIWNEPDKLENYSHDEITDKKYAQMPDVAVKPKNAQEIAEIMKLANKEQVPVTPRGAGSGLSGGAVPIYGGIVMLFDRMNKILEIDKTNMMAVVEPGVITNELNQLIEPDGLFFAGYPMSVESCYIGGNLAENAGGGRAVKYGVTGRYIMGLEFVTPEGEILNLGGKLMKNVVGFDLLKLLIGSEGTLGIFTKVIIKLLPVPKARVDLLVPFADPETAINAVPRIMTESGIIPTAIEFMDKLSFETSYKFLNEHFSHDDAGAMLLIELDGTDPEVLEKEYEMVGKLCQDNGALEVYIADNHTTIERVWRVRRNVAEAFMVYSPVQSLEDIVVPIGSIPKILKDIKTIAEKHDVLIPTYGHAGDGNLHATVVKKQEMSLEKWEETLPKVLLDLYAKTHEYGGSISGEHGIGHKRKKYMVDSVGAPAVELMKRIKRAFDPNNILNPGKIIDA
ncbi:MAG: FAD-binding protein [Candidatus Marinimicrobia bacterium]|nr:FAD-binding protein [Candidatus Neomarinimicrobiota bacterium]